VADPVGLLLARRLDLGRRPGRVLDRAGIRAASVEGALALLAEQL
jgi:hypothetical protein